MFQRQNFLPLHSGGGGRLSGAGYGGFQPFWLFRRAGTGALNEITCFTAADTLCNSAGEIGFHVDCTVLQQLVGHADNLGGHFHRTQGVHTKLSIFFPGFFVLTQQHAHFCGAVSGRPFHGTAVGRGDDLRHAGDATVGFHLLNNFRQEGIRHGITALFIWCHALRAQLTQSLALFGAQLAGAVTHPFIKDLTAFFVLQRVLIRILIITLLFLVFVNVGLVLAAQLFFAGNALIKGFQL